jgi:hypothetical protein
VRGCVMIKSERVGLDETIVDGCGLSRQLKRAALSVWSKSPSTRDPDQGSLSQNDGFDWYSKGVISIIHLSPRTQTVSKDPIRPTLVHQDNW